LKPTYSIAVRSLVEQTLRKGDLRFDFLGSVRPIEGIRAHQKIQRLRPDGYQAEASVDLTVQYDSFDVTINGRIDGILIEGGRHLVEEIKTTRKPLQQLTDKPNPIHWGQLKCYGYLWAHQHAIDCLDLQLTYVHLPGGQTLELKKSYQTSELEEFFNEMLEEYLKWLTYQTNWINIRDASIAAMQFPFVAYRSGQRFMAMEVYRTIRDRGQLLVQAATGIGKTMAALFPAVKALKERLTPKIVYLTARNTGRIAAETALRILKQNGLRLRSVSLTAKDKICFCPDNECGPEECQYAAGYYDRVNDALEQALAMEDQTRNAIEIIARDHRVCPFELSLELVSWADCIIGDYNYAFAPGVMLQRLFGDSAQRNAVIVDEAHNLVDRSREMFSAGLSKQSCLVLRRRLKKIQPDLYSALGRINTWLAAARRRCRNAGTACIDKQKPEVLLQRMQDFLWAAERWLSRNERTDFRAELLTFFFDCLRFIKVAENYDVRYATIFKASGDDLRVKLFCINPSHLLNEAWKRSLCAVLFSGTLTPARYYRNILGCYEHAKGINLSSPFPSANLAVFVADHISTLYRQREKSCRQVSRTIATLVRQRTGNYLIFFPSYVYLDMVYRQFCQEFPDIGTIVQAPEMDDTQRSLFLHRFSSTVTQTLAGFAVMGGIFSEGIDLKGERLTAAVIVGVGLPGICPERELIRNYFQSVDGCGFEFAYQYPGINRVLQAAGRVIRSQSDHGVVLLIDQRYGQHRYRDLLPSHWHVRRTGSREDFQRLVGQFWRTTASSSSHDGPSGRIDSSQRASKDGDVG
jgi:DNA excision repair protein ERCC-2